MPSIGPDNLCHHLTIDPQVKLVTQRRRKFKEEKRLPIKEETQKLEEANHIREIQYSKWLSNVVMDAFSGYN